MEKMSITAGAAGAAGLMGPGTGACDLLESSSLTCAWCIHLRISHASSSSRASTCDRRPGDAANLSILVLGPAPAEGMDWLSAPPSAKVRPLRTLILEARTDGAPARTSAPEPMSILRLEVIEPEIEADDGDD